jgi:hypothetical protein
MDGQPADGKLTIYLPPALKEQLRILPPRSVSRICQRALRQAVAEAERERDEMIRDALTED